MNRTKNILEIYLENLDYIESQRIILFHRVQSFPNLLSGIYPNLEKKYPIWLQLMIELKFEAVGYWAFSFYPLYLTEYHPNMAMN